MFRVYRLNISWFFLLRKIQCNRFICILRSSKKAHVKDNMDVFDFEITF